MAPPSGGTPRIASSFSPSDAEGPVSPSWRSGDDSSKGVRVLLGLDGLATGVITAVGAYPVRELGLATLRARRIGRCLRSPVCSPHPHLAAALPPLGYCHRFLSFSSRRHRHHRRRPDLWPYAERAGPCVSSSSRAFSVSSGAHRGSVSSSAQEQSPRFRSAPHWAQSPLQSPRHRGFNGRARVIAPRSIGSKFISVPFPLYVSSFSEPLRSCPGPTYSSHSSTSARESNSLRQRAHWTTVAPETSPVTRIPSMTLSARRSPDTGSPVRRARVVRTPPGKGSDRRTSRYSPGCPRSSATDIVKLDTRASLSFSFFRFVREGRSPKGRDQGK